MVALGKLRVRCWHLRGSVQKITIQGLFYVEWINVGFAPASMIAYPLQSLCADTWSRTCLDSIKSSHKWTIDNFSLRCQANEVKLTSGTFTPEGNDKVQCCLEAYAGRFNCNQQEFLGINILMLKPDGTSTLSFKYELHLVDVDNKRRYPTSGHRSFTPSKDWCQLSTFVEKEMLLDAAHVFLPDDNLNIFCEIIILGADTMIHGTYHNPESSHLEMVQMKDDFGSLLETHYLSDITLSVDGKDIQAHRIILAARSSVFSAMFKHDMAESRTKCVEIKDIDHEVFMEMLHFIYRDEAPNLDKMATKLLSAADKYGLEKLRAMCVEVISKSLRVENAVEILILSHLHNIDHLTTLTTNFICANAKDMSTEDLDLVCREYPALMINIVRAMSTREKSLEKQIQKKLVQINNTAGTGV